MSELQPTNRYHPNHAANATPAYLSPAASKLTPPSNGAHAVPATPASAGSVRSVEGHVLYERHNPLDDIEAMLGSWCDQKSEWEWEWGCGVVGVVDITPVTRASGGPTWPTSLTSASARDLSRTTSSHPPDLPLSSLVFKVDSRVTHLPGTPLPPSPIIEQFEDALMDGFVVSSEFMQIDHLNIDRTWLLSLYGRYRTLPNSLTDDQTALIYATLCVSRFSQIRASMNNGTNEPTREDLTYFHLACNALGAWGRPSTTALRE